jgi:hypothetical protein
MMRVDGRDKPAMTGAVRVTGASGGGLPWSAPSRIGGRT